MKIRKAFTMRASSIGDCLMGKYLLENIHNLYPEARCGLLVASKGPFFKDLFSEYKWLEVFEVNRRNIFSIFKAIKNFWGADFAVTQYADIGERFSAASKLFARFVTKKGGLVGFKDTWNYNKNIFDHIIDFNQSMPIFFHEQNALKSVGLSVPVKFLNLQFEKNNSVLRKLNLTVNNYIVVHLFSGNEGRGLSQNKRLEIVRELEKNIKDKIKIVLTGTAKEGTFLQNIGSSNVVNACGKLEIKETVNLIYFSKALLSLDTGIGHIGAHLNKPEVILMGCPSASWWLGGQYADKQNITVLCNKESCINGHKSQNFPACLNDISSDLIGKSILAKI